MSDKMDPTKDAGAVNIGSRLRELRFKNGWTLDAVSQRTGISPSVLSKLENNQGVVNIVTLQKLCSGLDLSLDRLTRPASQQAPGVRAVNKGSSEPVLQGERATFRLLSEDLARKDMFPVLITTEKSVDDPGEDWVSFEGERFIFVIEGTIVLLSEYYAPLTLEAGESTQFDGAMKHGVVSAGDTPATFLSVSYDATGRAQAAPFLPKTAS